MSSVPEGQNKRIHLAVDLRPISESLGSLVPIPQPHTPPLVPIRPTPNPNIRIQGNSSMA